MTCVRKHDDRQTSKKFLWSSPSDGPNIAFICQRIPNSEMVYNKNDKVSDSSESDDACVFERV